MSCVGAANQGEAPGLTQAYSHIRSCGLWASIKNQVSTKDPLQSSPIAEAHLLLAMQRLNLPQISVGISLSSSPSSWKCLRAPEAEERGC